MWHRPSGRSRQNPKVFPCWITYKRMCVIRRERNDLIATPNLRNERKESWSEPHLEDRIRLSFADNTSYTLCLSLPLPRFGCCVFLVWWSPPSRLVFPQPAATGAQTKPTVPRNRLRVARRLQARAMRRSATREPGVRQTQVPRAAACYFCGYFFQRE